MRTLALALLGAALLAPSAIADPPKTLAELIRRAEARLRGEKVPPARIKPKPERKPEKQPERNPVRADPDPPVKPPVRGGGEGSNKPGDNRPLAVRRAAARRLSANVVDNELGEGEVKSKSDKLIALNVDDSLIFCGPLFTGSGHNWTKIRFAGHVLHHYSKVLGGGRLENSQLKTFGPEYTKYRKWCAKRMKADKEISRFVITRFNAELNKARSLARADSQSAQTMAKELIRGGEELIAWECYVQMRKRMAMAGDKQEQTVHVSNALCQILTHYTEIQLLTPYNAEIRRRRIKKRWRSPTDEDRRETWDMVLKPVGRKLQGQLRSNEYMRLLYKKFYTRR